MNRRGVLFALLLCPVILLAAWFTWVFLSGDLSYRPRAGAASAATPIGHPWFGAVHVHTELSGDAAGALDEVVAAARDAGLDFIVVSEHTRALGSRGRHQGGWYDDVLVVVAEEISTTGGHLLAFGLPPHPYALGPSPRQAFSDVAELGGKAVIAHPYGGESSWNAGWAGAAGVEVVSLYDALHRASDAGLFRGLLAYPVNPMAAAARLLRAPSPAIDRWDERTRLAADRWPRRVAAIGSVDAHGPTFLGVPSYRAAFESVQMLVWMAEPPSPAERSDRVQAMRLVEALVGGRTAVVLGAVGPRPGFAMWATDPEGRIVAPGEVAEWRGAPWEVRATAAADATILLRRDGVVVAEATGGSLVHTVDTPGTYRAEVRTVDAAGLPPGAPPWILGNPVYVWTPETLVAASPVPVPPLPAPPVVVDLLTLPGWSAESDAGTRSAMAAGTSGFLWDVHLAAVEEEDRFAGLSWRPEGVTDWRERTGLAVALEAEVSWRVALRVWTRGPGGSIRTWERVIPAGPDDRAVAVGWADFRLLADTAGETSLAAELDSVAGVALVVTPQRMRPGTETRIAVTRFGLLGGAGPAGR